MAWHRSASRALAALRRARSMSNSPRLLGLIITAVLLAGGARGEDLPLPGDDDSVDSSDLALPPFEPDDERALADGPGDQSILSGVDPGGVDPLNGYQDWYARGHGPFL